MAVGTLILVETSAPGNLGSAIRVAANFGVPRLHLVRPCIEPENEEVLRWGCGGDRHVDITVFEDLDEASRDCRTLAGTASGRGRDGQPLIPLAEAAPLLGNRGLPETGLLFGNETSGLRRSELDACDLIIQVPTNPRFPVLNLTQTIAIVLGYLSMDTSPLPPAMPTPAPQHQVEELMGHLREALDGIGFLDPQNPQRMLRKFRRLIGRAGATENEVAFLRGICRQMLWAARTGPLQNNEDPSSDLS